MKTSAIVLILAVTLATTLADVYTGAKDQAKRGGSNPPNIPVGIPPRPAQNTPPVDPALAATQANIANLRADILALSRSTESKPSADERMSLLNHLAAAAQGTKPATASVQKLAGHLSTACLGKAMPPAQPAKLASAIHALFNGSHLAAAQQQTILDEVKTILTDAGTAQDATENVLANLKVIATETQ